MSVDLIRGPSSPALPRFLAPDVDHAEESPRAGRPDRPEDARRLLDDPGFELISIEIDPPATPIDPPAAKPEPVKPKVQPARRRFRLPRVAIAAVPVLAVNACAFLGQLGYLHTHLTAWGLPGQVLVAFTLESIAVYLSYHAHIARLADDAAFRMQAAAYALAAVIGVMNYSHWAAPHWHPTPIAITFALMSTVSPWLWGIYSRRESRDLLKARGLIEPHAVRLGSTRWTWHPVRSVLVMWRATWEGITTPAEAIAAHEAVKAAKAADKLPAIELDSAMLAALSPRDRLVVAFGAVGAIDVPKALALLEQHGCAPDQSHAYQIRKALTAGKDGS
jgi:hypothetical protein